MRFVLFFVTAVGAMMTIGALVQGDGASLVYVGPVTAVAAIGFWRNLRNPQETRKNGFRARVAFGYEPAEGVPPTGTFARVQTHGGAWHVTLDRMPERGDLNLLGVIQPGWVWLDAAGLPEKVRITYGNTWKTWPVVGAVVADERQEPQV